MIKKKLALLIKKKPKKPIYHLHNILYTHNIYTICYILQLILFIVFVYAGHNNDLICIVQITCCVKGNFFFFGFQCQPNFENDALLKTIANLKHN